MAHSPTEQQRKAIDANCALIVSAAAGSGKTATLANRVVRLVSSENNPIDITRLLIVTFTKSAAAEMRQRIALRLNEEYRENPQNKRLMNQMLLLPHATILTIDAFCKKIVTENYANLGLSPDIQYLNEAEMEELKEVAFEELFEEYFSNHKKETCNLLAVIDPLERLYNLKNVIANLYKTLRTQPFPEKYMTDTVEMYTKFNGVTNSVWGKSILSHTEELCGTIYKKMVETLDEIKVLSQEEQSKGKDRISLLNEWVLIVKTIDKLAKEKEWDAICSYAEIDTGFAGTRSSGDIKYYSDIIKGYMTKLQKHLQKNYTLNEEGCKLLVEKMSGSIEFLFKMVNDYAKIIRRRMDETGRYDFAEVELLALSLFYTKEGQLKPNALQIAQNYDEVLVDEYQDVNDLQDKLFYALSNLGEKRFVVGDVKQCIYRFRESNPENFLSLLSKSKEYYDGSAMPSKVVLSGNFRSRKGICDATNYLFSKIFSKEIGGINYIDGHGLDSRRDFPKRDETATRFVLVDSKDSELTPYELEAEKICNIIEDMMGRECITAEDGKTLRKPKYSDFTVLMRYGTHIPEMAEVLKRRGIPHSNITKTDFFAEQEIMQVISLLRVIDNPTDDVALLSALTSPMFSFTNTLLSKYRADFKYGTFYSALINAAEKGDKKARDFLEQIKKFRQFAVTASVDQLINKIYQTTGILTVIEATEGGKQRRANLQYLLDVAIDCRKNSIQRLDGFLRYVDRAINGKSVKSPRAEGDNAVSLTTIHNSKGLQYPVCFVAGCNVQYNEMDLNDNVFVDVDFGGAIKLSNEETLKCDTNFIVEAIKEKKHREMVSEELRIYYVALTRAVDNCFVLMSFKNLDDTLLKTMEDLKGLGNFDTLSGDRVAEHKSFAPLVVLSLLRHPKYHDLALVENKGSVLYNSSKSDGFSVEIFRGSDVIPTPKNTATAQEISFEDGTDLLPLIERRLDYKSPYLLLRGEAKKRTASRLTQKDIEREDVFALIPAFEEKEGLNAAQRGTALHTFMQYGDFVHAANNLEDELNILFEQGYLTQLQRNSIDKTKLKKFFQNNLFDRMMKSKNLMREHRFLTSLPAREIDPELPEIFENETLLVQGSVDCIFEEDDGFVMVDYKTDRVEDENILKGRYATQLDIYKRAFENNTGLKVKETLLYSFNMDKTITL